MRNKKTISELHRKLVNRQVSAKELLEESIEKLNSSEPEINAFVSQTLDKAREMSENVDKLISSGAQISQVAGIPTALKDNFNWTDTTTTASSNMLKDYISPYDATVTSTLLDSNAVIVGKANLDAFAHGSSTETSDFGVTKNPFDITRVAGGSSGGSAAAVAAGVVSYSIGSETAGSVRGPAAWCGLYGFAPTYGRISRYGMVAMGSSLDRPGVLANSVYDCALVTDILSGQDDHDATTIQENSTNYANNLSSETKKLNLGIPKQFLDDRIDSQVASKVMDIIREFEKLGYKIVEIDLLDPKYAMAVYTIVCRSEVSSNLARIDGIRYGHNSTEILDSVLDQIALNRWEGLGNEAKQRSMTGGYALSAGYYDAYYKKAQKVRTLIINDFKRVFGEVDLIVGPTMPTTAPKIGAAANNPLFGELADLLTESSALAGLPCISLPVGFDDQGLPIGMQIFGPQFQEQSVLDLAYVFENKISNE